MKTIFLSLIFFLFYAGAISQTTYYVAKTGSNSNNGSSGSPWLTIQYAIDHSASGDIIIVDGGSYSTDTHLTINKSVQLLSKTGLPNKPRIRLNYTSYGDCAVKIIANNVVVDGFEIDDSIAWVGVPSLNSCYIIGDYNSATNIGVNNWTVKNCNIHHGREGMRLSSNTNVTIQGNEIHTSYKDCIDCRNGNCYGLKVTQNILHADSTSPQRGKAAGIGYNCNHTSGASVEISYNYCYACRTFVDIQQSNNGAAPTNDILIIHNTIDWNIASLPATVRDTSKGQLWAIAFWASDTSQKFNSSYFKIRDNIFSRTKYYEISSASGALLGQLNLQNNLFSQWYLCDAFYPGPDPGYTAYVKLANEWPAARGAVGWGNFGSGNSFIFTNNIQSNPLYVGSGTTAGQYYSLSCGSPAINAASDGTNIGANQVVPSGPTVFTGTGNWEDAVRWSNGIPATCKDVTIHGVCSITSASALCNTLTIDSSAQLTLNTGKTLTISSTFLIRSTGSYLDKGTTVVNPANITVQRYMTGNWTGGVPTTSTIFHYLSSPVSSATSGMFSGDQLYQYNELTHLWDLITSSIVMTPGTGYAAALSVNKVKSFTGGSLNSSDITITGLTLTGGVTDYSGYHLIGNPYPCSLLWDNTWAKTNLDATACIWDHTNGHYWYHNGITGNGPFANGIIPAEQAFYIKANTNGASITIPQAKRLHSTQTFYKKEEPLTLSLKLSGDDGYDETVIMFTPGSTLEFDHPFDCQKLWGNDAATEIFSWIDGTVPASINVLPDETNCPAIPVGIKVGSTGSYSIDVTGLETFNTNITIFLEDKLTGAMQNLRTNPDYTFSSGPQTPSDPNRFLVHFGPTGIGVMSGPSIRIFAIEKTVYVNISEETQGTISIYNLLGEKIAEKDIAGNTINKVSLNVNEGIYIVNISGNNFIISSKLFIY